MVPHCGCLPPRLDADTVVHPLGPTALSAQGGPPPMVQGHLDTQQENFAARRGAQQQWRMRLRRRLVANVPAPVPTPAGPPATDPPPEPRLGIDRDRRPWIDLLPPDQYRNGETTLARQRRTRLATDEPIILDVVFTQCASLVSGDVVEVEARPSVPRSWPGPSGTCSRRAPAG